MKPVRKHYSSYFQSGSSGCLRSHSGRRLLTSGMTAKLYAGGGDGTAHSSVQASQGSFPAGLPLKYDLHQIHHEAQYGRRLEDDADGHDQIPGVPTAARLVGIDPSRHPQNSRNVHEVESEVEADEEKPEVPACPASRPASFPSSWEPVIEGGEEREENSADNHIVKVSHHEVRVAELPVERRRSRA